MPVVRPLRGAMLFGWPAWGWKLIIELLYMKPRPGVTTPDDEPSECVSETQLPPLSTTLTCVVWRDPLWMRDVSIGWPESITFRQCSARSAEIIRSSGTLTNLGSPRCRLRSANAAFMAIDTR